MRSTTVKREIQRLEMSDGLSIALHSWIPRNEIRKVVHISHGMAEHSPRYDAFAQFLNNYGIAVYAHDFRGHGQSIQEKCPVGHLADKNGFERVTEDLFEIIQFTKKTHVDVPYILLAHSFGSFVAQNFIARYGNTLDALILSGTTANQAGLGALTKGIAIFFSLFKGIRNQSKFLTKIAFGSYNKKIKNPTSKNAWLSSDKKSVSAYDADSLCGFPCTYGFYRDLGYGFGIINKAENLSSIPKTLPIFLFSGSEDPVSNYAKNVKWLFDKYKALGIQASLKIYEGARHECINEIEEISKNIVYKDILSFINSINRINTKG